MFARVMRELVDNHARNNPFEIKLVDNCWSEVQATLKPPASNIYGCKEYLVVMTVPIDYPFKPPKLRFVTKIFHMNVSSHGYVSIPELRDQWSPALSLMKIAERVLHMVCFPDPSHPMNPDLADLYVKRPDEYEQVVRQRNQ